MGEVSTAYVFVLPSGFRQHSMAAFPHLGVFLDASLYQVAFLGFIWVYFLLFFTRHGSLVALRS